MSKKANHKKYHKKKWKRMYVPKRYYKIARKMCKNPPKAHNIKTLRKTLMEIKLPKYRWRKFNCSKCSVCLDWYLKGAGFRTYLVSSRRFNHMWLLVHLDDGKKVAVEATLLTENFYNPPGIIDEKERHSNSRNYTSPPSLGGSLLGTVLSIMTFILGCGISVGTKYCILPMKKKEYFKYHRMFKSIYNASNHYRRGLDWWRAPSYRNRHPFSKW